MPYLNEQARKELLSIARNTLEKYLAESKVSRIEPSAPVLREHAGAFVSLHKGGELRGCIGQITQDRALYQVVQDCAVSAATEDPRFPPVTADEAPGLEIEISVLTPMKPVADVAEVEVGRHGLLISQGSRRGLLLPQVAARYNWSREVFLCQTCRKAGLPDNAWSDRSTSIYSFEAEVFSEAEII